MLPADALALLDIEGGERFALPEGVTLAAARDLPYEVVAEAVEDDRTFVRRVAGGARLAVRDIRPLRRYWCQQQGLVSGDDLRRLLWVVGTFREQLEVDLLAQHGVRLGDLWQAREWRLLLNLLDHLPRTTWTQSAMANHPEHAARVAEALARSRARLDSGGEPSTPLTEWTPEVATLAAVVDAVNSLRQTLVAVNLEKGKQVPKSPTYPRPRTLVDTLVDRKERALRWSTHEKLASALVPGRQT